MKCTGSQVLQGNAYRAHEFREPVILLFTHSQPESEDHLQGPRCSVFGLLSDESLWFSVHGRRGAPGEARRFHEDTVAWRAAEVHPVLDRPVVLACGTRGKLL